VKAAYAAKVNSGDTTYDNLKKMCDGMLATKDERWSLQTCLVRARSPATSRPHLPAPSLSNRSDAARSLCLQLELNIRLEKPLRMWLAEDVTIEGKAIGSLEADWGEVLCEAAGGDVNIWDFVAKVDGDALQAAIDASGHKAPVFKKLLLRLHFELQFPLTEAQAKKIKVTAYGPPEGVPLEPEPAA
jgi:hypothetical protein